MREKLVQSVNLLFAGNPEAEDIRQEILQNTLDRYDDQVAAGKAPEAAYSVALASIGDIGELLAGHEKEAPLMKPAPPVLSPRKKLFRSIAIGLYICCAIPLFLLQNELGLCLLLIIVAVATGLMIAGGIPEKGKAAPMTGEQKRRAALHRSVALIGTILYFLISFLTFAWHITWIMFLLIGAVNLLIDACLDLKESR